MCVVRGGGGVCGARSAHVTGVAEQVRVQGEALRAGLIGELLPTFLTVVTLKVIVLVHGHHPEDLLAALRHKTRRLTFPLPGGQGPHKH